MLLEAAASFEGDYVAGGEDADLFGLDEEEDHELQMVCVLCGLAK